MEIIKVDYKDVPFISSRDLGYITADARLNGFYKWDVNPINIQKVIESKQTQLINRPLIASILRDQYAQRAETNKQEKLIELVKDESSFFIITAHQPSLMTGPLYYVIKILSAISIAETLSKTFPDYKFIPCFVSGGEDHDFEEINHFKLYNKTISWESKNFEGGSVGKLPLDGIPEVLEEAIAILGNNSLGAQWINEKVKPLLKTAGNYSEFSLNLTHELFKDRELLILNMDDARFKKEFVDIMKAELLDHFSAKTVRSSQEALEKENWKAQAHVRDINLFYRVDNKRLRIEKSGDSFIIVDSDIKFSEEAILQELSDHPERFSPNVILRPLFQEFVLPNLAYVGGGGEVAYWLERLEQFNEKGVPFPMLIRRSSLSLIPHHVTKKMGKLDKDLSFYLTDEHSLVKNYMQNESTHELDFDSKKVKLQEVIEEIAEQSKNVDPTLEKYALAEGTKAMKIIENIINKTVKGAKKQEENQINKVKSIHSALFPGQSLMERKDNILEYINNYGWGLLDDMLEAIDPFEKQFTFIKLEATDLHQS